MPSVSVTTTVTLQEPSHPFMVKPQLRLTSTAVLSKSYAPNKTGLRLTQRVSVTTGYLATGLYSQ